MIAHAAVMALQLMPQCRVTTGMVRLGMQLSVKGRVVQAHTAWPALCSWFSFVQLIQTKL